MTVEEIFFKSFRFLLDIGYDSTNVVKGQGDYDLGIVLENRQISQKIIFVYYSNNPLKASSSESAISIRLFNKNSHVDFSRLFSKNNKFLEYAKYQYFILDRSKVEIFLSACSSEIRTNYMDLLLGKEWIKIDYDLRDDY